MWKRSSKADVTNYDALIKTGLTGHLGEAVREVQRQHAQPGTVEGSSEPAHTLCSVLEALFIHRLRDSFVDKVSSVLSGDVIRQPSPNFWPLLLGLSHRHSVDYLTDSCPWLRSDIGRCRGWIRLVLNDGMLSSYLDVLAGERRLLGDFYERGAYLRDPEHVDIARKLIGGVEMLQFRLAVNSSMLNSWSTTPLLLAGLWSPPTPLIHEAVVQGVDAALCFTDEDETLQPVKFRSSPTPSAVPKVDEDLAFRLILESERNIPSGILPPLEPPAPELPAPARQPPESWSRLSQSLPSAGIAERDGSAGSSPPQDADGVVLVTRLKLAKNNSRAPSPAVVEEPAQQAVVGTETPAGAPAEHQQQQEPEPEFFTPPSQAPPRDGSAGRSAAGGGDSRKLNLTMEEEETGDSSGCTFEDLLEDYSNLNMATKSPDNFGQQPDPPRKEDSAESSPGFELVSSGNLI